MSKVCLIARTQEILMVEIFKYPQILVKKKNSNIRVIQMPIFFMKTVEKFKFRAFQSSF